VEEKYFGDLRLCRKKLLYISSSSGCK